MIDEEGLAKLMYDNYCDAVGGKAFNGDPLPQSEEFFKDPKNEKQANGWRIAAITAFTLLKPEDY